MNRKLIGAAAFVAVLALVAGAIGLATSLGTNTKTTAYPGWPTYSQSQPHGCRPVAPGAYSTICDNSTAAVGRPATSNACHPVAPGAFTEICDGNAAPAPAPRPQPAPDTLTCTPVAPGAFTEVCARH